MNKVLDQFKLGKAQMNKLGGGDKTYDCFIFNLVNGDITKRDSLVADNITTDNCQKVLKDELGDGFAVRCYEK